MATPSLDGLYAQLEPITLPPSSSRAIYTNWGLSYSCSPVRVFIPETEEQCRCILELARHERRVVRAVGVGHSPSDVGCTKDFMIRTDKLNRILEVNTEKNYVTAQAGIILSDLHVILDRHNLAMSNVGSISDQTLGGIITTATHGAGINFGVISTHVLALTLLLANGSRVRCSRHDNPDLFIASICGLGTTGLILDITLQVEPAFRLRETQESLPFDQVINNLEDIIYSAEHVRLWWFAAANVFRVSCANRTQSPPNSVTSWIWHSIIYHHLIQFLLFLGLFIGSLNYWISLFASWLASEPTVAIDDSHRIFNLDCRYPQYTTEWAIPYDETRSCLIDLRHWLDHEFRNRQGLQPHFPIEIRWSASDDIWLSPSNGQKTCWIGIIQYKPYGLNAPYRKLFAKFEEIMLKHHGRPHWAKCHELRPDQLRHMYPRFDDFVNLIQKLDPDGLFRSEYVQRHIFGVPIDSRVFKIRQL